jgi:hypothetical protein
MYNKLKKKSREKLYVLGVVKWLFTILEFVMWFLWFIKLLDD